MMEQNQSVIVRKPILQHVRETAESLFYFSGRAERTKIALLFFFLSPITSLLAWLLTSLPVIASVSERRMQILLMAVVIPTFVRRLHDQDRAGWWALLIPGIMLVDAMHQFRLEDAGMGISQQNMPLDMAKFVLVLPIWVFILLPGTDGPNRYGPDPRRQLAPAP